MHTGMESWSDPQAIGLRSTNHLPFDWTTVSTPVPHHREDERRNQTAVTRAKEVGGRGRRVVGGGG